MKPSILRNLLIACVALGLIIGAVFPLLAQFLVDTKPGMGGWFYASCITTGIVIGLLSFTLVKMILVGKLQQIGEMAQAINRKDVSHRCDVQSDDVVGEIADSFNLMATNLREIIGAIHGTSGRLGQAAKQLTDATGSAAGAARDQQQQTEQMVSAMQEMTGRVQLVVEHASEANDSAARADQATVHGKQVVTQSIGAIEGLATEVDSANGVIEKLAADSGQIGAVLEVIRGIAEQTNLLALNAAIEAARAGEQGRGFAVVADEVRTLASRTRESTQEIQQMIERFQAGTRNAAQVMKAVRDRAQGSVQHVSKVAEVLNDISGSVDTIKQMNVRIADAARDQDSFVDSINNNVGTINRVAGQVAEGSQRTTQQTAGLASLTDELGALVRPFRLN